MRTKHILITLLIIIAIIWLPTGTPEDIPTTFFLIKVIGIQLWILISLVIILILWKLGVKI